MKKARNLTFADTIWDRAVECSEALGMSVSAFISMLIANYKKQD